jgi:TonB-linked SusC/RagA family outer membrane protein
MKHILKSTLLTLFAFVAVIAQGQQVTGQVTDSETGEGLPGATVLIKGTTNGAITDIEGKYSISANQGDVLVFTFLGFVEVEREVNSAIMDVVLLPDFGELEEVVVVGYTTQKKKDLTGSVSVVDVEELGEVPYANVLQALAGRVSGINIQQDGQPGQGRTQIRVRGVTTLNNNSPLYVIDGVPTTENLDNLNPNDIESIQVLKDASASIYGVRSAGGVVIITTKKGRVGQLSVDAGMQQGIQTIANKIDLLDATQWGEVYWDAFRNAFPDQSPSHDQYGDGDVPVIDTTPFLISNNRQVYRYTEEGTDWYDEVYRNAGMAQYFVNVSSGSERGSMLFGLSYFDQEGLIDKTYYERITGRINTNQKVTDWINIGENLSVSWAEGVSIGNQQGQDGIPLDVIRQHPLLPVFDATGGYAGKIDGFPDVRNMVSVLEKNKDNTTDTWRIFGNMFAEVDLFEPMNFIREKHALRFRTSYAIDYSKYYDRRFNARFSEGQFDVQQNSLTNRHGEGITGTWSNTLEYNTTLGKHYIKVLAGQEAISYDYLDLEGSATDFEIESTDFTYLNAGSNRLSLGSGDEWGIHSYFGRVEYTFADKYLLTGLVRQDKTSRFDATGYFPSVTAGWKISEESFFSPITDNGRILNSLKLRVSYGIQGNQAVDNSFTGLSLVGGDINHADYDLTGSNTDVNTGYIVLNRGNPNLEWEKTTQSNVGFDAVLLDNHINLNADFYSKNTEDIIFAQPQIAAVGEGTFPLGNVISIENKGFDLSLGYYLDRPEWSFSANLQISRYVNEVTDIPGNVGLLSPDSSYYYLNAGPDEVRVATGQPFGSFFGYEVEGIFQNQAEADAHAEQGENAPGRLKFKDQNNDGLIDANDRTFIGDPNPDLNLGLNLSFSYKGIAVSTFLYSSLGNDVYNTVRWYTDFAQNGLFNRSTRILDAWGPDNTGSSIPAPTLNNANREDQASSYYVEDGSFLKMRSFRTGYTIPQRLTWNTNLSVYGEIQNVFTVTGYTGVDPEVPYPDDQINFPGIDRGVYPLPRIFLIGLNIKI